MLTITHDDRSFERSQFMGARVQPIMLGVTISDQGSISESNPRGWCGVFGRCIARGWTIDAAANLLADRIASARLSIAQNLGWPTIRPADIPVMLWAPWGQPSASVPSPIADGGGASQRSEEAVGVQRDSMSWPTLEPHPALGALRKQIPGQVFAWCGSAHRPNTGTLDAPKHEPLSERSLDHAVACAQALFDAGIDGLGFDALARVRTRDADVAASLFLRLNHLAPKRPLMYERHVIDASVHDWWRDAHGVLTLSPPGGKKPGVPWWMDPIEELFDVPHCAFRGWQPVVLCHAGDPAPGGDLWSIDDLLSIAQWLRAWSGSMIVPIELLRRVGLLAPAEGGDS